MSTNELPEGSVPLAESLALVPQQSAPNQMKLAYEPIKPLVLDLADGRRLVFATPKMSISEMISGVLVNFKSEDTTGIAYTQERSMVKFLTYLESIDGEQEPKVCTPIMRAALEQKIGNEFLQELYVEWGQHFITSAGSLVKVVGKS